MGSSESFVKFDKVDKSYDGETLVVKNLNVDIPQGEFLTAVQVFSRLIQKWFCQDMRLDLPWEPIRASVLEWPRTCQSFRNPRSSTVTVSI